MRLTTELWLSAPIDEVFQVFTDAATLELLSPRWVHCRMLTPRPAKMGPGAVIDYRLRLHGIPFVWRALVSCWDPPWLFIDEQLRGPYRRWVHTHTFAQHRGGTTVGDSIEFDPPLPTVVGPLVSRDLRRVFQYRHAALFQLFQQPLPGTDPIITII